MSASLLDELLGDWAAQTPAKAAIPANREHWRGLPAESAGCEALRIAANANPATGCTAPDSQAFAGVRNPSNELQSKERRGLSQDSQDSQPDGAQRVEGDGLHLAAVAWTDENIRVFLDRRARLLRWGWAADDAEELAQRLVLRDREADARVSCAECQHYTPGRCANHRRAGLVTAEVGRDLAGLLQRCAGFKERS
jgi:hypothetical protein